MSHVIAWIASSIFASIGFVKHSKQELVLRNIWGEICTERTPTWPAQYLLARKKPEDMAWID